MHSQLVLGGQEKFPLGKNYQRGMALGVLQSTRSWFKNCFKCDSIGQTWLWRL